MDNFHYDGENIEVKVKIDDIVYQQYLKTFERETFERNKRSSKLVPPEGW